MCRNIKTLYNFDPPATQGEMREAALQFVRKISGFRNPSAANAVAFTRAVDGVYNEIQTLLRSLATNTPPKNRDAETMKLREKALKRFGSKIL